MSYINIALDIADHEKSCENNVKTHIFLLLTRQRLHAQFFCYHVSKQQDPQFLTHRQPYDQHTHSGVDMLPKWYHGSKVSNLEKPNFELFLPNPSKIRLKQNILAAPRANPIHDHKPQDIPFPTHYHSYQSDNQNKLYALSKLRTKSKNQENPIQNE